MENCKKSTKKIIAEWIIALTVAILILNIAIVPLYHFAPWIDTPCNATTGLFAPDSTIIYGLEGFSVRKVDTNGYVNPEYRVNNNDYILVMGASHSVGKEVISGKNYVDLLERDGGYNVYNIAMDGNYFVEIMQGFDAAVKQFDGARSVVIEIGSVNFTKEELEQAKEARDYNPEYTGERIKENMSLNGKIKMYIQNYFPLLRQIQRNIKSTNESVLESTVSYAEIDTNDYINLLDSIFAEKRNTFDGDIIIVYHPSITLKDDGLEILKDERLEDFKGVCIKNDIEFMDLSEEFSDLYYTQNSLPYGFNNTVLGRGHLNKNGHRAIADKLIDYFDNKR